MMLRKLKSIVFAVILCSLQGVQGAEQIVTCDPSHPLASAYCDRLCDDYMDSKDYTGCCSQQVCYCCWMTPYGVFYPGAPDSCGWFTNNKDSCPSTCSIMIGGDFYCDDPSAPKEIRHLLRNSTFSSSSQIEDGQTEASEASVMEKI